MLFCRPVRKTLNIHRFPLSRSNAGTSKPAAWRPQHPRPALKPPLCSIIALMRTGPLWRVLHQSSRDVGLYRTADARDPGCLFLSPASASASDRPNRRQRRRAMKGRIYRLTELLQKVERCLELEERRHRLEVLTSLHLRTLRMKIKNAMKRARPADQSPPEAACRKIRPRLAYGLGACSLRQPLCCATSSNRRARAGSS